MNEPNWEESPALWIMWYRNKHGISLHESHAKYKELKSEKFMKDLEERIRQLEESQNN